MRQAVNFITMRSLSLIVCILIAGSALWISCKDEMDGKTFLTSDDMMIDDYITGNDPSMSEFLSIADKAGFRGMLHAYGTYTCFVPTNDAVASYLKSIGKSSVSDLTEEQCQQMIKYHVVRDTLRTSDFVDGRLYTANMQAKYLTTRTVNTDGGVAVQVDRQATILEKDIAAANGYIHKINQVLIPPALTCGEQIMKLPDEYSLFRGVMDSTGWMNNLTQDNAEGVWYSVFLHSNDAFGKIGIYSEDDLVAHLRVERPDIQDKDSLLWTFAAYHCVKGLYYVADLTNTSALQSQAPNQAITFKLKKDSLLVNEYSNPATGTFEKGIAINKKSEYTDYSCYNGVLLDMDGYIGPVKRQAQAVYWDVAEQPELLKNSNFRKASFNIPYDGLSEIKMTLAASSYGEFAYGYRPAYESKWQPVNMDYLAVRWYRLASMEMKLPLLNEGTYNVWICWRQAAVTTCRVRGTFIQDGQEEQELAYQIRFVDTYETSKTAEALLGSGMKRYTAKEKNGTMVSRLMGTIQVQSTGRHTLRFDVVDRGRNADIYLDMIHFIPVDDDQLWPRFDMKGNAVYRGADCGTIYPYSNSCSSNNDDN